MENEFKMEDELCHYGVLGMKWGIRKANTTAGSSKKSTRKNRMSDDAREAKSLKKKRVNEMSNAELRKLNERQQLEQNYSRLNPKAISRGLKYVAAAAGITNTVVNLYNNSDKIISIGKQVSNNIVDGIGNLVVKDLNKHL